MLKNLYKRLTKSTPLDNAYKEFDSIRTLENKRFELQKKYGTINEDIALQKQIINNNFLTLAHLFADLNKPKIKDNTFFSIQGTLPYVFHFISSDEVKKTYTHARTKTEAIVETITKLDNLRSSMFKLERKFQSLKYGKGIKSNVRSKIESIAKLKMDNKIIDFCNLFKGNEEVVRAFIFRNMDEPDEDYHNELKVIDRLDFLGFLLDNSYVDISDSEDFSIKHKDLILIDINEFDFHRNMNLEEFFNSFKSYKYDFIFTSSVNSDGSPIAPKARFIQD